MAVSVKVTGEEFTIKGKLRDLELTGLTSLVGQQDAQPKSKDEPEFDGSFDKYRGKLIFEMSKEAGVNASPSSLLDKKHGDRYIRHMTMDFDGEEVDVTRFWCESYIEQDKSKGLAPCNDNNLRCEYSQGPKSGPPIGETFFVESGIIIPREFQKEGWGSLLVLQLHSQKKDGGWCFPSAKMTAKGGGELGFTYEYTDKKGRIQRDKIKLKDQFEFDELFRFGILGRYHPQNGFFKIFNMDSGKCIGEFDRGDGAWGDKTRSSIFKKGGIYAIRNGADKTKWPDMYHKRHGRQFMYTSDTKMWLVK